MVATSSAPSSSVDPLASSATLVAPASGIETLAASNALGSETTTAWGRPADNRSLAEGTLVGRTTVLPRVVAQDDALLLEPQLRDRYARVRRLGEGAMGEVELSEDQDIGRRVALKRLGDDGESPAAVARFVDEVRTMGSLDHPNITPIYDVGRDHEGRLFFTMKYVEGESLESLGVLEDHLEIASRRVWIVERTIEPCRNALKDAGVQPSDIDEIVEAYHAGKFQEAFGAGTAAVVAHVSKIKYGDLIMELPPMEDRHVGEMVKKEINGIRSGRLPDRHHWIVPIHQAELV